MLSLRQDLGFSVLMCVPPKRPFISLMNSSNPGPINTLMTIFPSGFRISVNIHFMLSINPNNLIASTSLTPIVLGAMSDWMTSNFSILFSAKIFLMFSLSVISATYVFTHGRLRFTSLRSTPMIFASDILFFLSWATAYCIQLPGAHQISRIVFVFFVKIWNFSWISSNLKALLALYPSFFAFLK